MRILGMELGGWSIKAVEMESRFRRVEILDLHEVRLPLQNSDPSGAYKKAVEELMARLPSHPEKVVTSLPSSQTALRFLQVPVKQRKKVEQSFKFDLEDSVPFKLEDCIIEHHVHPMKDGSLVFAAMAPKRHVQTYLEWLKNIGIEPDWLTFDGMGVINLFLSSLTSSKTPVTYEGPVLLLDLGHVKTNLAIIDDKRLELSRSVPWGGASINQAIASALVVSLAEAEQRKLRDLRLDTDTKPSNNEQEELITASLQSFTSLVTDISHSLVSYRSQFKKDITQIVLTGGTARTKGIDGFLSKSFGAPVSFFKPFQELTFAREVDKTPEMRFGEAVGRAFVFSRKSELLFNFRKEEMAKGTSLSEISQILRNPAIIKLGQFAAVLAGLLFVASLFLGYLAQEDSKKASDELKKVFADTFKEVPVKLRGTLTNDPEELKKYIDRKNNELAQKLKMSTMSHGSMLNLLRTITEAFPTDVQVDVNVVKLDDRSMRLEGVVYNGDIKRVEENLKKNTAFTNVALEQEGQRFSFKGDIIGK